jgi:hypothetical protein
LWNEARTLSECEAWLDLIQSARFEATVKIERIVGREVSYSRGQYPAAIRFLTKKWNWSERRVRIFLEKLVRHEMVSIDNSQGINVITLTNYEKYNGDTANDTFNELNNSDLQRRTTQQTTQLDLQTDGDTANDTFNDLNNSNLQRRTTQQTTQPEVEADLRHADDTNNKKEKKDNNNKYFLKKIQKKYFSDFSTVAKNTTTAIPKKEKEKNCAKKEKEFKLDFIDEKFKTLFLYWLEYRKQIKKPFKSQMGIEICYKKLLELSNNNILTAEQIVNQSIANEYQGLFPLKETKNGQTNTRPFAPVPDAATAKYKTTF